jgi:hypothetical protein
MGGQDSFLQLQVLLAQVVANVVDERVQRLDHADWQTVQNFVVFSLGGFDVAVLEHGLNHGEPDLWLV